jgi:metal-responsive CopG/Arc/MetJ family transcriptional regulator
MKNSIETMPNVKIAISLQKSLFEQAEALAQELHISRSRLFVLALEDFIHRHQSQQLLKKINAAYEDVPTPSEKTILRRMRRQHKRIVEGEW